MLYKDIMSLQSSFRTKIVAMMEQDRLSIDMMAQLIGISPMTLSRFIVKEKDVRFVQFCKIKSFIASISAK